MMTHGSLFSGIGGFEIAAEWAGWTNAFHCEWNEFGKQVLKYYWPESESFHDIKTSDFKKYEGRIDIITGGFPCQPFSAAGKRKGADDDRYLWPEMLRVIDEVKPRWVVGENVAGLISMVQPGDEVTVESGRTLFDEDYTETVLRNEYVIETVCKDLERLGYTVQPVVIPACAAGAPHRRDRIWFIAHTNTPGLTHRGEQHRGKSTQIREGEHCISGCGIGVTAHSDSDGFIWSDSEHEINTGEGGVHALNDIEQNDATDPCNQGLQGGELNGTPGEEGIEREREDKVQSCESITQFHQIPNWDNFPTQSPVCFGNDGIPSGLVGITVSKHRMESIKAAGNAIVPQVAYEIFKAINEIESR
jgi:DNA (cytosine-5)-methyltransferase 1